MNKYPLILIEAPHFLAIFRQAVKPSSRIGTGNTSNLTSTMKARQVELLNSDSIKKTHSYHQFP